LKENLVTTLESSQIFTTWEGSLGISDDIKPRKYRRIIELAKKEEESRAEKSGRGYFGQAHHPGEEDFFDGTPIQRNNIAEEYRPKTEKTKEQKNNYHWLYTLIISIVILSLLSLIVWQNYSTIKSFFDGSIKEQNDQNLNDLLESSSKTLENTESNIDNKNTEKTEEETSQPTAIDKSQISISVLNGSGIKLAAKTASDILIADGFTIKYTGNASSFNYQKTYIYFKTGKEAEANLVKQALEDSYSVLLEESNTVTGSLYDLVVVAGKS